MLDAGHSGFHDGGMETCELHLGDIHPDGREAHRAEAMLVRQGRVVGVGDRSELEVLAGTRVRVHDHGARTVLPGFVDSHLHLFWLGSLLVRQANLVGVATIGELLDRMAEQRRASDGPWVLGRGWDDARMAEGRGPTRTELDSVVPDRPAIATRVCGHCVVANSRAIALLDPEERDAGDADSGRYTETAIQAFLRRVPPLTTEEAERAVLLAQERALRVGITSVGTLLDTADQMQAYHRLHRRGALKLRVTGMPPRSAVDPLHAHGIGTGFGDDRLRFGGAKWFADGSLGARTALLAAPYADEPNSANVGVRVHDPAALRREIREADGKGFQAVIHAIGDQAVREAIDAIEDALRGRPNELRHRIEHVSVLPDDLLRRMVDADILAVVQPQFVVGDTWTPLRLGAQRARDAYPFARMRRAGIRLALSSDCPVEELDPFALLAAAVHRHPWSPEEVLNLDEALADYTVGSAYAIGTEKLVGTLAPGKAADFVVLDRNPWAGGESHLRGCGVAATVVGGERVHAKEVR